MSKKSKPPKSEDEENRTPSYKTFRIKTYNFPKVYKVSEWSNGAELLKIHEALKKSGKTVSNAYNPDSILHTNPKAAVNKYKTKASSHKINIDHVVPKKQVYHMLKDHPLSAFLSQEDKRTICNMESNLCVTDEHTNKSKRDLTNSEYVKKHDELSESQKAAMLDREKSSKHDIQEEVTVTAVKNITKNASAQILSDAIVDCGQEAIKQVNAVRHGKGAKQAFKDWVKSAKQSTKSSIANVSLRTIADVGVEMIFKTVPRLFK